MARKEKSQTSEECRQKFLAVMAAKPAVPLSQLTDPMRFPIISTPAPVRPASFRSSSISSASSCPGIRSKCLSDSDQATDIEYNSDVKPLHSGNRRAGTEIVKGKLETESLRNCSRSAGKELAGDSTYRMESAYLPSPVSYASFGFDYRNRVTLTHFPEKIKDGIRSLLDKGWEQGIQKEGPCNEEDSYFFKLKMRPFSSGNTYVSTRMTRNMIAYLASESWLAQPVPSILNPYDTLNFRKSPEPFPKCYWLAMTYGHAGKWRLKDVLSLLGGADELIDTVRLTLQEMNLISKLKKEHVDTAKNWHQFCIKGTFLRAGTQAKKKKMILRILERLEERGWVLYIGYHRVFHAGTDYEHKVGTWLCVKSREWTPTDPVKISWSI
ncbi:predicted protein [Sclerotinia sclerotiorum 1980 UF-70]|uniref:Uncharacterized protein n=2 Tax=Sclerotinia sclerotiorum (strain ATCC 18683 / 1980 / Ss-1) TaxID=665079 RepID=A7EI86_SCLS1|nr:predicted protein [Sclerotinia sclerotiorum 1980 UF-70]APA11586.1 hypothetical protein sscle_08g063560 [Sclerotinia sclerotiorum 1980 UF-70]EDO02552.1 predicted protein [Sclerotinia sclerotiorum 1980 UF-70]